MSTAAKNGQEPLAALSDQGELIDLETAAERLFVSKTTLYRMLDRGEVKGIKVGRQWRFRPGDIDAYLSRGPVATALAALPLDALDAEVAAIADKLRLTGDDMPAVDDPSLDQWEMRIVRLLLGIMKLARVQRASDVHFEVMKEHNDLLGLIRFRIDGVLHEVYRLPIRVYEALVLRMRIMASGDPGSGGYLDASLHLPLGDAIEDMRISVMSTFLGEAVTVRLHSASDIQHTTLDLLGFHPHDLLRVREWLRQPAGLIFTAGPAGCGKTTLLYKMLQEIASPSRKVVTIEDPVEHQLPWVTQTEFNQKTRNIASALRAFMRHDVDAVMVGELRDLETIEIAIHMANNRRLTLCPVHTASAVEALTRVVEVFPVVQENQIRLLLAQCVVGAIALRLVRMLCPACKQPVDQEAINELQPLFERYCGSPLPDNAGVCRAVGCEQCGNTGYRGRTGLYEVMEVTPQLRAAFLQNAPREELRQLAIGERTLVTEGLRKVIEGITTFEEVDSLIKLSESYPA